MKRMEACFRKPGPRLAPFVESLWFFQGASGGTERVLPSGRAQLIIDLAGPPSGPSSLWAGPRTGPVEVSGQAMTRLVGVVFEPAGAAPFLPLPCAELRNLNVELEALWGASARELRDWLREAPDATTALLRLERSLIARLRFEARADPWVSAALPALDAGYRVDEVIRLSGASRATLMRRFERDVGLTPKQYARLHRFQRALKVLARGGADLARVAVAVGFSDQAHMNHDFKKLGGVTPSRYRPLASGPNHVPSN